jgi:hypothetical protein
MCAMNTKPKDRYWVRGQAWNPRIGTRTSGIVGALADRHQPQFDDDSIVGQTSSLNRFRAGRSTTCPPSTDGRTLV